jgi:peptidyl-prolyl cis-trans isomerase A (cyclophilin A)
MPFFLRLFFVITSFLLVFSASAQESSKKEAKKSEQKTEAKMAKEESKGDSSKKGDKEALKSSKVEDKPETKKQATKQEKAEKKKTKTENKRIPKRMFAKFTLTHGGEPFGEFTAKLFFRLTPKTVENFVGLAEGEKPFREPLEGQKTKVGKLTLRPFYNGVAFHRVIRGFMIQGGDPTGTGRYTPGYEFNDEFHPNLKHDKKGLLSMANPGKPNSNGSQFFITVANRLPHLDRKHSIFGEVVDGLEVVEKASQVKTDLSDKPVKPLVMQKVEIIRKY